MGQTRMHFKERRFVKRFQRQRDYFLVPQLSDRNIDASSYTETSSSVVCGAKERTDVGAELGTDDLVEVHQSSEVRFWCVFNDI